MNGTEHNADRYALVDARIYTGYQILDNHALIVQGDKIEKIISCDQLSCDLKSYSLKGYNIAPGFIDLQLNGCGGVMFNSEPTVDTLEKMHKTNLHSGTTTFLPTFITSSDEKMKIALDAVREYKSLHKTSVHGIHFEGPYLNLEKRGIHNSDYIRSLGQEMRHYLAKNSDMISKITLAPEKVSEEDIRFFIQQGIIVSLGHTQTTYTQAKSAMIAGASFATHLFNAMTSIQGREPGLVGAVFDSPEVYCGIIADGFHVDYANIRLAHLVKKDKLVLVTDAVAPAGTKMKSFDFVGQTVYYQEGKCVNQDGTLGGSALTMIEAIKNCVQHVGIALDEALRMATLYPARAIKANNIGQLTQGSYANITIFDDNFDIDKIIVEGEFISL